MRTIIFIVVLVVLTITSFGQNITYNIPEGYETEINKGDYKQIVNLAIPIVEKRYSIDYVEAGTIHLKKGQDMQAFNLHNLITKCVSVKDKSQWGKIVQEHFESIFSSIDEQKKIDPKNFETIKTYLSLRVYPQEVVSQRGGIASFVVKTDLEGTYTMLMLDLPGAFTPVQKQMFDLWKVNEETVFDVAQSNINKLPIEKVTRSFDFDGAKIELSVLGNEDYAASYALDLMNNSPELVGEWGSVVAIPNKGLVNLIRISKDRPVDFVKFIQMTKPFIEKSFQDHEQPISDQFFWYYKGEFVRINVQTDSDGSINVISPAGLTALMTEKK